MLYYCVERKIEDMEFLHLMTMVECKKRIGIFSILWQIEDGKWQTEDSKYLYPLFSVEKKGYNNFVPKLGHHPSVCVCMRRYIRTAVMFLVNASPKLLDVATANFAGA